MKALIIGATVCLLMAGCIEISDSDRHDSYESTTYSSCRITYSDAVYSADRSSDLRQCWDGVDYLSESRALDWCGAMVNNYMNHRYTFGHTVEYRVSRSRCAYW